MHFIPKVTKLNNQLVAKTFSGLEFVLAKELKKLGANNVRTLRRGVRFEGNKELMYASNYYCRSALSILRNIASFRAENEQQLYDAIRQINWSDYLKVDQTFAVDGLVNHSNMHHSKFVALKTKDAIADYFREKYGKRPNVDTKNPVLQINIRVYNNECMVSLDSSGEALFKRGYRQETGIAPINEVLAAGMILLTGWSGKTPLIDPMCGSGTIPIEAGMIANKIPAGYFRDQYGFMRWKDFDNQLWQNVKDQFIPPEKYIKVYGSDQSGIMVSKARKNTEHEFLREIVQINPGFFEDLEPWPEPGIIITNPPYGERMRNQNLFRLYSTIGKSLKNKFKGYQAWIITSDMEALRHTGLKPDQEIKLFNGKLESLFVKFSIFDRKHFKKRSAESVKKGNKHHTFKRN